MFLSRVEVDSNNRQKLKDLTHLGAYHNWVEQSFPDEVNNGVRLRHLWRLDRLNGTQFLLVLSSDKPDLAKLEHYGIPGTAATKDYELLVQKLRLNQELRFRLTANPTRSIPRDGKRGLVSPHVTVVQQMEWLVKRSERAGFRIVNDAGEVSAQIVERGYPTLRRTGGRPVRLSRVTFEGQLEITDLDSFVDTLQHGLGREKAYGMGMLTVIPEPGD